MTGLKADLDELSHRAADAKVNVDDEDAKLKLLEFNAKLAELNRKVARPRIDVAGAARAELQVAAIRAEMDALDRKSQQAPAQGILSRLLLGAEGAGGAAGGAGKGVSGAGGILGALPPQAQIAALGAIVAASSAAVVELTGLVSGFAAAGVGAGAFAALAMPAFKQISGAFTQIQADQTAYNRALTQTARNDALKHLKMDYAALDPEERKAVTGIQHLTGEFGKISKAFQPQVFKVFNDVLQVANNLLPDITPFAQTFADAVDKLLKRVGSFTGSAGFKDWLKQFHSLEGPAITAIGDGIGRVAVQLGKLLTTMSAKDVVHALNIAFDALALAIQAVTLWVRGAMKGWDEYSSAFRRVRHDTATGAHDIAHWFDDMRRAAAIMGHDIAHVFDDVRGTLHRWYSDVVNVGGRVISWFGQLPGRIVRAVGDLGRLLVNAGRSVIQGLINGIESMIPGLGSVMSGVGNVIKSFLPFSPAKQGPLSGSGAPENSGRSIARQLALGIAGGTGDVHAAMGRLTAAVGAPGVARAGYGAYSTAGRQELVIRIEGGDEPIMRAFRQAIRVRGGNVQLVLGQGAG